MGKVNLYPKLPESVEEEKAKMRDRLVAVGIIELVEPEEELVPIWDNDFNDIQEGE